MGFGKQAVKVWLVTLSVFITLGFSVVIGAAQGDGQPLHALDKGETAFLPLVASMKPATTLPFADGFGSNMSPHWTVYPYHGEDWRQDEGLGIYWYNYDSEETDADDWWGLSMYLGPGSELWADYEVVAIVKSAQAGSKKGGLNGLWLRGSYEETGRVGGYYVHLKRRTNEINLWRLNPGATNLDNAQLVRAVTYAPGIGTGWYSLRVRVQGANIQAWLKERDEPASAYRLVLNWTDPQAMYMQGTVGLSAYRSRAVYDNITVTQVTSSSQ